MNREAGLKGIKTLALGALVALVGLLGVADIASATPSPGSLEVKEYRKEFGVSAGQANEALAIQENANDGAVAEELEGLLGSHYGGIWFDNKEREYVVPLPQGASASKVALGFAGADIGKDDFRTVQAQSSWDELVSAQNVVNKALLTQIEKGFVQTSLDPRINAVVIRLASGAGGDARREAQQAATSSSVRIDIRAAEVDSFKGELEACSFPFCDAPLRGGTKIYPVDPERYCTAAFPALGPDGTRFLLTAGHCVEYYPGAPLNLKWWSNDSAGNAHFIGSVAQWEHNEYADWAKINANGSWWEGSWPRELAYWGSPIFGKYGVEGLTQPVDLDYSITGQAANIVGNYACHSGIMTGTTCGYINELNVTNVSGPFVHYGLVELTGGSLCSIPGDSGGPYFAGHSALGIHVASANSGFCGDPLYYRDISEATTALHVSLGQPFVTANATALNGNPGWLTVKGEVQPIDGSTVKNAHVNIKLFKFETGAGWVQKATLEAPVTNNAYEIKDWNGVGPGQWMAKAIFPAQGGLGESTSDGAHEGWFTVKDGYRIVNKNSGKCLDVYYASKENGASTKQQYCADPTVFQNQVYTLVPEGNGYLKLKPRHSGGCLEIAGASQSNGALLQQWACNGSTQQSWQPVTLEESGGTQYIRLVAKHSGKCLDVLGGSTADGASVGQWECNTTPQQKWSLQSVDSGPVATEVTETAPEGERLNGQPGYASVHGYVKTGYYGIPSGDSWVNVNFEKEVSPGSYELIKEKTKHPTLNSEGFYEVKYEGLATGNWKIWTGFPGSSAAAPSLAASQSEKVKVEIHSGYRFVFRHSSKCLTLSGNSATSGTSFVQWACNASPSPGDGQVFTLVPKEVGYFNVVVNSTGKCVDVTEWSQAPGTWLKEYPCGEKQTNQLWQVVPIAGQSPWNAFVVKHSGQCMDVYASSTANGAQLVQWTCNWGANEQWSFQGVG